MLATLLWGDSPETTAKTNLRAELFHLKKQLQADSPLEISRQTVRLNSAMAAVDVILFRTAIRVFLARPAESQAMHLSELANGITLYRGDFLAGFYLADAPEFDEWQRSTQEALHEQAMLGLTLMQQRYAEQGAWLELAQTARRQLEIVPWQEAAHRGLIQALAAQGLHKEALAQYDKCTAILQEELGVEPEAATREMGQRLRSGRLSPKKNKHNLARQLKTFVGRDTEIAQLHQLVQTERLVTLLGIGGVGKSHLSQVVAQRALHDFADGVWFVPLASIETSEGEEARIALAISGAIGYQIVDMQAPMLELSAHLAAKQMLLVLDNCEQIGGAIEMVLDAVIELTTVHVLATSRRRLMVGERPYKLDSLPQAEAFTLFVDRANRLVPGFAQGDEADNIAPEINLICRQVAGLPLGIELASSWVEHFSAAEIGQSLADLVVEPEQAENYAGRHHSLYNVLTYSWQLLSPHQQEVLARLSVFRGGFDRPAATAVAQSSLGELSILIGHSLVQRISAGRYNLHPIVQDFAAGKLSGEQKERLNGQYSDHYLTLLKNTERTQRANQLKVDYENILQSWQAAVQADNDSLIQPVVNQYSEFIIQCGLLTDGYSQFGSAIAQFEDNSAHNEFVAQLLHQQWGFSRAVHGLKAASELQERLLTLTDSLELRVETHTELANRYAEEGRWDKTNFHFDQAEAEAQNSSDIHLYIYAVERRIHVNILHFREDFAEGIGRLQEMLRLLETVEPKTSRTESLRYDLLKSLSLAAMRYGNYSLAISTAKESLRWATEIDNRLYLVWSLLDIALSQTFSGLFEEAITNYLQALAAAEMIGAADDIGLLKANLCLTMRQSGSLTEGLAHGVEAVEMLQRLRMTRQLGQARNRVGHTLLALKRWDEAYHAYGEALQVWATMQHPNQIEAVAGRAVAALSMRKPEEASRMVDEVLAFTQAEGVRGVVEPVFLYLNLEHVLSQLGRTDESVRVLQQAQTWVEMIAARIGDEALRHIFLHNRPDHQRLERRLAALLSGS